MFQTTIYFPSFDILCKYRRKLACRNITLFAKINVLAVALSEEEIHLACKHYRATVIQKQRAELVVAFQLKEEL